MARPDIFTAGVEINAINAMGLAPWDTPIGTQLYVGGRYSDEGPLEGLLWCEIRREYPRMRLDTRHATWFELYLLKTSTRRIGELFEVDESTVRQTCKRVRDRILHSPHRGIITSIVEDFGWDGLRYILSGR